MSSASTTASTANPTRGRWGLVVAALLMQLSLGAVYAWSAFSSALQKAEAFKLTKPEATLPFEVAIGMIFIGTYLGGRIQDRRGPKTVAMIGAAIYGVGVIVGMIGWAIFVLLGIGKLLLLWPLLIIALFAAHRVLWVCITPFGSPVVPDVKMIS